MATALYSGQNNGLDTIVNMGVGVYNETQRRKVEEAAARAAEARAAEAIAKQATAASAAPWWKSRPAVIGGIVLGVVLVLALLMRRGGK